MRGRSHKLSTDAYTQRTMRWRLEERSSRIRFGMVGLLLAVVSLSALGTEPPGAGDAAHFLRDGLGARGRGMGSAYIARADDFTAPFWNPAPTVQSPSSIVGGGLEQRNAGLFTFSVFGGWHAAEAWGAGAVVVTSDLYDVYHIAGGLRLDRLAVGIGVKSYRFGIPGDSGSGLGLDIGARYALELDGALLRMAAVSRDVGWTSIRWGSQGATIVDRTAWVNRLGIALSVPLLKGNWTVELDAELSTRRPPVDEEPNYWEEAGEVNLSLGTAFRWAGISVRAGLQRYDVKDPGARVRPSIGLGIVVERLSVDLALIPSPLGSTYLGGFHAEL